MAKLSASALICTLVAANAVLAAPGFAAERRGIESLLVSIANKNPIDKYSVTMTNRSDIENYFSIGDQALSALYAGKLDAYYSYVDAAAVIADKYMDEAQVASYVSQIIPALKLPSGNSEFDSVRNSYLSRLEDSNVQHHIASVVKVVNELAAYQASYVKSAYGIDINSIMAQYASLALGANKQTEDTE
ncbi:hypothetical protein IWW38_004127, partial [Coemansia aciculifera]